ncbi:MAG: VPLPA-CTERM sorting domain-containing protein [Pseudomonadota bacterium]
MRFTLLASAVTAAALSTSAQAATIDFNAPDIQGMVVTSVSSTDGTITAALTADGGADQALVFDTTQENTEDRDLEDPFRPAADSNAAAVVSPGGVLIIQETLNGAPDDNQTGGSIAFAFNRSVNFTGFKIFDGAEITVSSSTFQQTFAVPEPNSEEDRVFDTFSTAGLFDNVRDLTFTFAGSGAIDDIQVSAVPVPASLPLLLAGLGGLGWAARRRRKAA